MKSRLPILCTAIIVLATHGFALGANVSYAKVKWNRISANVVYVNMDSPDVRVTPALAKKGTGSSESFGSMVNRMQPTAAITGTFFCTKSLQPTGDIVIEGKRIHSGCVGTALCITDDGRVQFRSLKDGRSSRWQGCQTVMCAGPTLVRAGRVAVAPKSEGFKDPEIFRRKPRAAVGYTDTNRLLMVTVSRPIYLGELAKLMAYLGATDAVDLDGGSSTALYYEGEMINRPARSLTNLLVVYKSTEQYAANRSQLAPDMPRTVVASTSKKTADTSAEMNGSIMAGMSGNPSQLALVSAPHWDAYRSFADQNNGLQMISSRLE